MPQPNDLSRSLVALDQNSTINVRRAFPPAYTCLRLREESIDDGFKLVARKETCP
jgi:hypothetical protein